MTGFNFFTSELGAKRLELLRELVPGAAKVAVLVDPAVPRPSRRCKSCKRPPAALGLELVLDAGTAAISMRPLRLARAARRAFCRTGFLFNSRRDQLVHLATRHKVPAIYPFRDFSDAGGLMSYGASITDAYRQIGVYAGRILKGEKPADLPVMQPTKFELVINLKTARLLGLEVPPRCSRAPTR